MTDTNSLYKDARSLDECAKKVHERCGRFELTRTEQLVLCCEELARTYTRDEKNYR